MKIRVLRKIKINPISLILLKILIMGLIGIPIAYFFDKKGYINNFAQNPSKENFILISYLYTLYGFMVIALLYYGLGLKRKINTYIDRKIIHFTKTHYELLWLITFVLALLCFGYVFFQAGTIHPAIEALKSDYSGISVLRHKINLAINMNIYNVGFKFFLPINIIISLLLLKRRIFSFLSIFLFVVMGTFVLEKGVIVSTLVLLVFFRILLSKIPFKKLLQYGFISLGLISVMYFLTRFASSLPSLFPMISGRILYGQISDLPTYFELFSKYKISLTSIFPPYLTNIFGHGGVKAASLLVMEHTNPTAVAQGTAGVANTFFIGEAYAVAGHIGAILSPFIIMVNLVFFVYLFTKLKKNIYLVFLFSWFLFRTFDGIFVGIGYFIFSGIQIILLVLFYYLFSYTFVKNAKKIKMKREIVKEKT
jgi:hypothetical protein